jgi:hypothetical protein
MRAAADLLRQAEPNGAGRTAPLPRSSPAATARASAGADRRTWCWSPKMVRRCSPTSRTSWSPEPPPRARRAVGPEPAVGARSARVHAVAFLHAICGVCLPVPGSPRPAAPQPLRGLLLHQITVGTGEFSRGGFRRSVRGVRSLHGATVGDPRRAHGVLRAAASCPAAAGSRHRQHAPRPSGEGRGDAPADVRHLVLLGHSARTRRDLPRLRVLVGFGRRRRGRRRRRITASAAGTAGAAARWHTTARRRAVVDATPRSRPSRPAPAGAPASRSRAGPRPTAAAPRAIAQASAPRGSPHMPATASGRRYS